MRNTIPLRISSGVERHGGITRSINPFGKDMAVVARPSLPDRKAPRITTMRHPGRLIQRREVPKFETSRNPLKLPVYTPKPESISRDRVLPKKETSLSLLKVIARGEKPISDTQKLVQIRQEIQRFARPQKIQIIADKKTAVPIPVKHIESVSNFKTFRPERSTPMPKLDNSLQRVIKQKKHDFLSAMIDRQKVKFSLPKKQEGRTQFASSKLNHVALPKETFLATTTPEHTKKQSPINTMTRLFQSVISGSLSESEKKLAVGKIAISDSNTAEQKVTAVSWKEVKQATILPGVQSAVLAEIAEYVDLLKRLEEKKGERFTREKARTLSPAAFIEIARTILSTSTPTAETQTKTVSENIPHRTHVVTRREVPQRRNMRFETTKGLPEKPFLFEEDPVADAARVGFAVEAVKELFKDPKQPEKVTGYTVSRLMPHTPQPIEVKSSLLMRLKRNRMRRDGSYDEVLKQLGKSGILNSVEDTKLRMKELTVLFPAVRVGGEQVTTRAVSEEDVVRVFGGKAEASGDEAGD